MLEHSDSTLIDGHSYLTLSEVCLRYGMSRKTLREKCNLGMLGELLKYPQNEL